MIGKEYLAAQRGGQLPRHLFGLPLVLLPLLLGGARPWFWSIIAGVFTVDLAWSLSFSHHQGWKGTISRQWAVALALLLLCPLLQILPLPASWMAYLSPQLLMWRDLADHVALTTSGHFFSISYSPLVTFFSSLWWVFLAGYVLLFRQFLRDESNLLWFCRLLFWVAGIEACYGLMQTLIPSLGVLWESEGQGVARGTFVNRNHYAAFLGMLWPVLLAFLLCPATAHATTRGLPDSTLEEQKKERQKRLFLGFVVGLILLGQVFSMSRGGISAALISLTVFVVLGKTQRRKGLVAFLVGCWVVMLAYGSIIGFGGIITRFNELEMDASGRGRIWEDSWQLIRDHWLTGAGLGCFPELIRVYQSHLTDQFAIVHAHNDYLELAGELGVPVATTMVLLVWGYWWACARRILGEGAMADDERGSESRGDKDGFSHHDREQLERRRLLAIGALAGSASFLCHSWVDFNWQIPANQFYFLVLLMLMNSRQG